MKKKLLLLSFLLLLLGCTEHRTHTINFYYWKSNVSIGEVEQEYFKSLHSAKLYMRFFDVDTQEGAVLPVAKVQPFDAHLLDAEYIPVVFITNRTFAGMQNEHIQVLARNMVKLIDEICSKNKIPAINEIQIDCDWTESTKNAYFQFLRELERVSQKSVTCTIRLHQVKFKDKTGVPPVSKGYLMCYATSGPKETGGKNSILDMPLLKDYTATINDYPLDVDVALPLFSWAIVTNHLGHIKLINNVTVTSEDKAFLRPTSAGSYEVTLDTFFHGFYLNKGFTLKVEQISPALLREAKQYLNEQINKDYGIVYYHLDAPFLTKYTLQELY
ncbi:MAG: hypothetical protein LBN93_07375 [Candidatus Symbiothrix sp.]|jgi:hypothetical protein|nr:hypothetical protein [Candidatus Symbiothrix sp.]